MIFSKMIFQVCVVSIIDMARHASSIGTITYITLLVPVSTMLKQLVVVIKPYSAKLALRMSAKPSHLC